MGVKLKKPVTTTATFMPASFDASRDFQVDAKLASQMWEAGLIASTAKGYCPKEPNEWFSRADFHRLAMKLNPTLD